MVLDVTEYAEFRYALYSDPENDVTAIHTIRS